MKKQHRFLVAEIPTSERFSISEKELVHLIRTVLKIAPGESCRLFSSNSDDLSVKVVSVDKDSVIFEKITIEPKVQIPITVTAALSITKRDTFEMMVQKLTELGVHTILPIISDRTIKQALRLDRLQKISDEAMEQSGHSQRVLVCEPKTLEVILVDNRDIKSFYFDTDTKESLSKDGGPVLFYVGPEGGWSDREKELFKIHGVSPATLGNTVLRAETAAIVATYTLIWQ